MNRFVVLALLAVALLSSCDNPNSPEHLSARIQDADANARRAIESINDLESRVSDLESQVSDLETKLGQ